MRGFGVRYAALAAMAGVLALTCWAPTAGACDCQGTPPPCYYCANGSWVWACGSGSCCNGQCCSGVCCNGQCCNSQCCNGQRCCTGNTTCCGTQECCDPAKCEVCDGSGHCVVISVEDMTFDPNVLYADGTSTSQASATISPAGRGITWSIPGNALGCTISSSGLITAGTTEGTITVRAADSQLSNCYGEAQIEIKPACDQTETDNKWVGLDIPDPNCTCPGSCSNPVASKGDSCGNTLTVTCEGAFHYRYNGEVIGTCPYKWGVNTFEYMLTKNKKRFYATRHRSRDLANDGSKYDEGTRFKYDWVVWKYDCINESGPIPYWREHPTMTNGWEEDGDPSDAP